MKRIVITLLLCGICNAATLYCATDGDDSDNGSTPALAKKTLASVMDSADDTDVIYVESGKYATEDGSNDSVLYIDDAGGAGLNMIHWVGVEDLNDVNEFGIVEVNAADATLANAVETTGSLAAVNHVFNYFVFCGASGNGINCGTDDDLSFYRCAFIDNGADGISLDNYGRFFECLFDGNTTYGAEMDLYSILWGCIIRNNGNYGIFCDSTTANHCLFYDNGTGQLKIGSASVAIISGCTFDGNGKTTIGLFQDNETGYRAIVTNNIFYQCSTAMVSDGDVGSSLFVGYNLYYDNTANVDAEFPDHNDVIHPGVQHNSFVSASSPFSSGYELADATPSTGGKDGGISAKSALNLWDDYNKGDGDTTPEAGTDYLDIGAFQREESASTSSSVPWNKGFQE